MGLPSFSVITDIITLFYHNLYGFWEMVEDFSTSERNRPLGLPQSLIFLIKNEGHNERDQQQKLQDPQ